MKNEILLLGYLNNAGGDNNLSIKLAWPISIIYTVKSINTHETENILYMVDSYKSACLQDTKLSKYLHECIH